MHPNLFLPLWIRLHSTNGLFAQELQTHIALIADHLIQIYRFDSALIPSIIYNWTYHAFEDDNPEPHHNTHIQPTPTHVAHGPFYYIYEAHMSDTTDEGSSGLDSPWIEFLDSLSVEFHNVPSIETRLFKENFMPLPIFFAPRTTLNSN